MRTTAAILISLLLIGCATTNGNAGGDQPLPRDAAEFEMRLRGQQVRLPDDSDYWCVRFGGYAALSLIGNAESSGRLALWEDGGRSFEIELFRLDNIEFDRRDPTRFIREVGGHKPELPSGAHWKGEAFENIFDFAVGEPRSLALQASWNEWAGAAYYEGEKLRFVWIAQSGNAPGTVVEAYFSCQHYETSSRVGHVATWDWRLIPRERDIALIRYRILDFHQPRWDEIKRRIERDPIKEARGDGVSFSAQTAHAIAKDLKLVP